MRRLARPRLAAALAAAALLAGCAGLGLRDVIQPPRFREAEDRPAQLRLLGPSIERPTGGAAVRLWARVSNPNAFGLTLRTLDGTLFLEDTRAAGVSLPLGLPLPAAGDTIVPIEVALSFSDLPDLLDVARSALGGSPLDYRLDGRFSVDAGPLGTPSFGPMLLLRGELDVVR